MLFVCFLFSYPASLSKKDLNTKLEQSGDLNKAVLKWGISSSDCQIKLQV